MKKLYVLSSFLVFSSLTVVPVYAASNKPSTVKLTVVCKSNEIPKDVESLVVKNGGKVVSKMGAIGSLEVVGPADLITKLQSNASVASVGPTLEIRLPSDKVIPYDTTQNVKIDPKLAPGGDHNPPPPGHDLYDSFQWDIKRVTDYGASYDFEKGNHNTVIGIIDTGVNPNHPDLQANFLGGRNYVPAGFHGDSTETGDPTDFADREGHGSHVAGTIAGNGEILGVAPDIGYRAYRVFASSGGTDTDIIANAIIGATNDGVDVISMSLGGFDVKGHTYWTDPSTGVTYDLGSDIPDIKMWQRAIKYATDHGVTVVAAAGNDGIDAENPKAVTDYLNATHGSEGYRFVGAGVETPGSIPGVITVSATGTDDQFASYSNYGSGFVDITAPGGDATRYPNGLWWEDMCLSAYGGPDGQGASYAWMEGTSMATPKVAAVAGLIIAHNGKMAPNKVASMIKQSADELNGSNADFGAGMVQAPHAPVTLPSGVEWQHEYGSIYPDYGQTVHETKDGGTITVGATYSYATFKYVEYDGMGLWTPNTDVMIVKSDKSGHVEWRKVFGKPDYDWGNDIVLTKDGGYLAVGYTTTGDAESKIYLMKLDKNGDTMWTKEIGLPNAYQGAKGIVQGSDGGYVLVGNQGVAGANDIYLLKIDENGNKLWNKTYGGQGSDTPGAIIATRDGGYAVAAQSYSGPIGDQSDFYVLKVDKSGNKQWETLYTGYDANHDATDDYLNGLQQTADGGYVVVGKQGMWETHNYVEDLVTHPYIAKLNAGGKVVSEHVLPAEGRLWSIQPIRSGGFVTAGTELTSPENFFDFYLATIDNNGNVVTEKTYGGSGADEAYYAEQTKDGGYLVTGSDGSTEMGEPHLDWDMYVAKLSSLK